MAKRLDAKYDARRATIEVAPDILRILGRNKIDLR
jgi:hypothetical protein